MSRWLKIILILSVILNVLFIVGTFWARSYITSRDFELAALYAEAEARFARLVLTELEYDEPARIEALKLRLKRDIEQAEKVAGLWRAAAEK